MNVAGRRSKRGNILTTQAAHEVPGSLLNPTSPCGVNTQATSQQRTTGGISHATGVFTGLAMNAAALIGMRSPGGIYSAGLLGAGTANYGINSGFKF